MNAVVDRVVQYPHRYQLKNVGTGEVLGTFDLEPITGTISIVGTKIDKALFDSIANDIGARLVANGGDAKDNIITYTMASGRSNIVSGEKLSVSFGKIAKYLSDLKAVAFSGNKADIGLGNVDNTADKDKNVKYANSAGAVSWTNVSDKPSTFTPSSHTHSVYVDKTSNQSIHGLKQFKAGIAFRRDDIGVFDNNVNLVLKSFGQALVFYGKVGGNDYVCNATLTFSYSGKDIKNNYSFPNKSGIVALTSDLDTIKDELVENEYNLGYYDTIIANDDGSYTITRQTGYLSSKELLSFTWIYHSERRRWYTNDLAGKLAHKKTDLPFNGTATGIENIENDGADSLVVYTNAQTLDALKSQLYFIYIQYKLKTSTTEIVEKNHYSRYNERFILEHNKQEAERSANLLNIADVGSTTTNGITYSIKDGVITLNGTANGLIYIDLLTDFGSKYNGKYLYLFNFIRANNFYLRNCNSTSDRSGNEVIVRVINVSTTNTILSLRIDVGYTASNVVIKPMLVEGSTPPTTYQPYEGKVVHESGLNAKQDKLVSGSNIKTINDQSIVGAGNISIPEGLFELVGNGTNTLTISKDDTYFIINTSQFKIYVSDNPDIGFYGSAIISTLSLTDNPHIAINGVAYELSSEKVTLLTDSAMKVYKMKE